MTMKTTETKLHGSPFKSSFDTHLMRTKKLELAVFRLIQQSHDAETTRAPYLAPPFTPHGKTTSRDPRHQKLV